MALGPVMADIEGLELTAADRELLLHPNVGGVILFARNYESREQLLALTQAIHALRQPRLLIAVDHEGGRVQRFREGFTQLPPMAAYGELYASDKKQARALVELHGWLAASELLASGIDLSFSPVLDLRRNRAGVIGERAIHLNPQIVSHLATGLMLGMRKAGMAAVGKHFPGHGGVKEDTHLSSAQDMRHLDALESADLLPYRHLISNGLAGIMTTHVQFPNIDRLPASYSPFWLRTYLRGELGFSGTIFSDDLGMAAARSFGAPLACAQAALHAGCDMILPCNNRAACQEIVVGLGACDDPVRQARCVRLHGQAQHDWASLLANHDWQQAHAQLSSWHDTLILN